MVSQENEQKKSEILLMESIQKLARTFASSGLELKDIVCSAVICKGLVGTGADQCLMQKNVYQKLGIRQLSGLSETLKGVGDGHILTFGSFTIAVKIDNVEMNIEFHVVPDEDIAVKVILGTTILDFVDIVVTKDRILLQPSASETSNR